MWSAAARVCMAIVCPLHPKPCVQCTTLTSSNAGTMLFEKTTPGREDGWAEGGELPVRCAFVVIQQSPQLVPMVLECRSPWQASGQQRMLLHTPP